MQDVKQIYDLFSQRMNRCNRILMEAHFIKCIIRNHRNHMRRAEIHFSEWNINQYYFTWTWDSYTFHGCFKEDTYFLLLLITNNFLLENHHIQHLTTRWQPALLLTSKRSACKERKKKTKQEKGTKKRIQFSELHTHSLAQVFNPRRCINRTLLRGTLAISVTSSASQRSFVAALQTYYPWLHFNQPRVTLRTALRLSTEMKLEWGGWRWPVWGFDEL